MVFVIYSHVNQHSSLLFIDKILYKYTEALDEPQVVTRGITSPAGNATGRMNSPHIYNFSVFLYQIVNLNHSRILRNRHKMSLKSVEPFSGGRKFICIVTCSTSFNTTAYHTNCIDTVFPLCFF